MPKEKDDFEFDDCPVCQAMKASKAGTMEELKEAFKKAKEQGAVVGGMMFDEEWREKREIILLNFKRVVGDVFRLTPLLANVIFIVVWIPINVKRWKNPLS